METNEPQKKSFKDRVLETIEADHVKVYSKTHFTMRVVLVAVIAVLAFIASVFLFNIVFFNLRISGRDSLLDFGASGIWFFLQTFPWLLSIIVVLLVAILAWLLRRFKFGYRTPVLYALAVLIAAAAATGFVVDCCTSFNAVLLHQADQNHLPAPLAGLYQGARRPPPGDGFCKCLVIGTATDTIFVQDTNAVATTTLTILVPPGYLADDPVQIGEMIFVAGRRAGSSTIQAFGVGQFPTDPDGDNWQGGGGGSRLQAQQSGNSLQQVPVQ